MSNDAGLRKKYQPPITPVVPERRAGVRRRNRVGDAPRNNAGAAPQHQAGVAPQNQAGAMQAGPDTPLTPINIATDSNNPLNPRALNP